MDTGVQFHPLVQQVIDRVISDSPNNSDARVKARVRQLLIQLQVSGENENLNNPLKIAQTISDALSAEFPDQTGLHSEIKAQFRELKKKNANLSERAHLESLIKEKELEIQGLNNLIHWNRRNKLRAETDTDVKNILEQLRNNSHFKNLTNHILIPNQQQIDSRIKNILFEAQACTELNKIQFLKVERLPATTKLEGKCQGNLTFKVGFHFQSDSEVGQGKIVQLKIGLDGAPSCEVKDWIIRSEEKLDTSLFFRALQGYASAHAARLTSFHELVTKYDRFLLDPPDLQLLTFHNPKANWIQFALIYQLSIHPESNKVEITCELIPDLQSQGPQLTSHQIDLVTSIPSKFRTLATTKGVTEATSIVLDSLWG